MNSKLLIAFLLLFFFGKDVHGQNIDIELSKLFFNVDVSKLDNTLLKIFLQDTSLHKLQEPNDTVFYPSRNPEAKSFVQYNFTFTKNTFLKTQFVDGNLGVITGHDYFDKDFTVLFLAFEFKNGSYLDSAYSEISATFKKLGQLENRPFDTGKTIITNIEYRKRVEIFTVLFPFTNPESFILYVYLKKMKT
jgi:hypothetical protein